MSKIILVATLSLLLLVSGFTPVMAVENGEHYETPLETIQKFIGDVLGNFAKIFTDILAAFFNSMALVIRQFFAAIRQAWINAANYLINGGAYWGEQFRGLWSQMPSAMAAAIIIFIGLSLAIVYYFMANPQQLLALRGLKI